MTDFTFVTRSSLTAKIASAVALLVTLAAFILLGSAVGAQSADDADGSSASTDSPTSEALRRDAEQIASENGWDVNATLERLKRQRRFDKLSEELAARYPENYGGGWMGKGHGGNPFVRFTGAIPEQAREKANEHDLTVDFRPDANYSLSQLKSLKDHVHRDLVENSHQDVVTAYKVSAQKVYATAVRPPGSSKSDEEMRSRLSERSRSPEVEIQFMKRSNGGLDHSYGGLVMWVDDGDGLLEIGESRCTSGFTVVNRDTGTTGVATAGHCGPGVNYIQERNGNAYSTDGIAQHRGEWGDFEWHTTPHAEPKEFYTTDTTRRDVKGVEPASWIDEGDLYRNYGYTTNEDSDYVYAESVSNTVDGITYERLVAMENREKGDGDSGGPWYVDNSAAGFHHGGKTIWFEERDLWAKAYYIDEGLGVYVRTK